MRCYRDAKPWTGRDAARELFPQAKPTPQPFKKYTIESHDQQMKHENGINIMTTRFWDPLSGEWNAERFYNGVIQRYFCPFVCEYVLNLLPSENSSVLTLELGKTSKTRMRCVTTSSLVTASRASNAPTA